MKKNILLVLIICIGPLLLGSQPTGKIKKFSFRGKGFTIETRMEGSEYHLYLRNGFLEKISEGIRGENILPQVHTYEDFYLVSWINFHQTKPRLCFYHSYTRQSEILNLPGFKSFSYPEIFIHNHRVDFIIFIGNNSNNNDVFYYSLKHNALVNITATPYSEKRFELFRSSMIGLKIHSLAGVYRIYFDPLSQQVAAREKLAEGLGEKQASIASLLESRAAKNRYRTLVGFGDSITSGMIRMHNLEGDDHPELAYLNQLKILLEKEHGKMYTINLGLRGESTADGALRIDTELDDNDGKYLFLQEGTNDTWQSSFDLDSALEDMAHMVDAGLSRNRVVIISTVPPRKDGFEVFDYVQKNVRDFNNGIIKLAKEKKVISVDIHALFINYSPPSGWKSLLEDIGGVHPNPTGHKKMAELYFHTLLDLKPATPSGITKNGQSYYWYEIIWDGEVDFDLSGYQIQYGYSPAHLTHQVLTTEPMHRFHYLSFSHGVYPRIYYTITAIDTKGNESAPTSIRHTD